ncbi:MAG: GtrA family protein [Thermodesulfobacteriota bacterium]
MGLLTNVHDFLGRKECPYTQFAKYIVCGGISVVVDALVFYLLGWLVFPCLQAGDPVAQLIEWAGFSIREASPGLIIRNYWIIKGFCFFASNITVYLLNVLYVFEAGKHRRHHEVLLFFTISLVVFLGGTWFGSFLIKNMGWHTTYAYLLVLVLGIFSNYALRKFVVFKR